MGDRTYVSVRVHPMDWHLIYDILDFPESMSTAKALWESGKTDSSLTYGGEEVSFDGKAIAVTVYEANYGYYDEWIEAASRGARFCAYHSYGGDYGPGNAIGLGFKHYYIELTHEGDAFVRVNSDLTISEEDMERFKEYNTAEDKFESSLNKLPDTWEEIISLCHNKMPNG